MSYKILESNEMHFKTCTKCSETLPATTEYFHKRKGGKYGLYSVCKKCRAEQRKHHYEDNKDKILERNKQYYEDNKDKIAKQRKQYYEDNKDKIKQYYEDNKDKIKQYRDNNKDKIAERGKQYRDNNKDKIAEYHKQYYEDNKDKIAEYHKQWYEDNKDKIAERDKQYYEDNKDKIAERGKQYYKDNKDKHSEYMKQWYEDNKDKVREYGKKYRDSPQGQAVSFNRSCRRRTKEQNQGNGINKMQWLEMMKYFNWECAYSGETLKDNTRSIDHIKPLVKGGEHEVWNTVPMYRPYNSSKRDKKMEDWYQEQDFYSEERLKKIYEWQEYAYNKYSKK